MRTGMLLFGQSHGSPPPLMTGSRSSMVVTDLALGVVGGVLHLEDEGEVALRRPAVRRADVNRVAVDAVLADEVVDIDVGDLTTHNPAFLSR